MTTRPFPSVLGPFDRVYWMDNSDYELFGELVSAPMHTDGTFNVDEMMPVQDFAEPLTHGQTIDVLLGLGGVAVLQEREQRRVLEALCVAGKAVLDGALEVLIQADSWEEGDGATTGALEGLGKALDAARACLKVPDDYSTADHFNPKERA